MAHWYPLLLHPSTTSATQTHAKQATVSTASHIQLQMSLLWAPALFDVMNNEDGFSFVQVSENCNAYCLGSSHQAVRPASLRVYSCPSYIPSHTVQIHTLTDRFVRINKSTLLLRPINNDFLRIGTSTVVSCEASIQVDMWTSWQ